MVWEDAAYTGYKLNCHKKKRKVESLIELYDKDSVNSVQDKDIYKQKLEEISAAALNAVEYISELIEELEVNAEVDRISELKSIKDKVISSVKKNEKEVKAEMQRILEEAANSATVPAPANPPVDLQQVLASLNLGGAGGIDPTHPPSSNTTKVAKLTLKQKHLVEDAEDFQKLIVEVKVAPSMTDSEVIYYMRLSRTWDKKVEDLVSDSRKFQVEALDTPDFATLAAAAENKVKMVKTVKENKLAAISNEDQKRGLNSLCENKNRDSVVFPEPFKGNFGDNVFKFREDITAAIKDSQVKKADQVKTLLKYLKGDARARVGDCQPDLEAAMDTLVKFYGNTNLIWLKCKQDFEQNFSGELSKHWGELGSTKRVDSIAKVMEFIRLAQQYAVDYPELKNEIISSHTVTLLTKIMPIDYMEMIYLAMDDVTATPKDKIDKMNEILGKLKTCGILAVNQLVNIPKQEKVRNQTAAGRNPLGLSLSGGTACSVDSRHECHRNSKCQPNWGLLGCVELYQLRTVEERAAYCRESNCCYVCGRADLSGPEKSDCRHQRCDYRNPVDRLLTKCTAWKSKDRQTGRKLFCFYGAALCPDHQKLSNTSPQLLDWLKEKKVKHELFALGRAMVSKSKDKVAKTKNKHEHVSDKEALDMLKHEMESSECENGDIQEIPEGENMFMFFLMQGKPGTDPIQVFCDSGANFWFAVDSVTKKLVSVQTYKGALPINVAGGKVVYSTGEWVAAIPLDDGTFQAVRGLTMKSVVGQMPRYDLTRTLNTVKSEYKNNTQLQNLVIPPVLGGEVDMILGSKYLKIYPEPVQVTPSGLTVSMSRLRTPDGVKAAVISGPVKFINQIFQSQFARDCIESMKAMLLQVSSYKPTLEYFPKSQHIANLVDYDIPGVQDLYKESERKNKDEEVMRNERKSCFCPDVSH